MRESVARMRTLPVPAMTAIIGLVMGWVMLSVLGPMYDVIGGVKL